MNNTELSASYTVFVGGVEVNDYYLHKTNAIELALQYIDDGYSDVEVNKAKFDGGGNVLKYDGVTINPVLINGLGKPC